MNDDMKIKLFNYPILATFEHNIMKVETSAFKGFYNSNIQAIPITIENENNCNGNMQPKVRSAYLNKQKELTVEENRIIVKG